VPSLLACADVVIEKRRDFITLSAARRLCLCLLGRSPRAGPNRAHQEGLLQIVGRDQSDRRMIRAGWHL
jgi:hypothetical protein